MIITALGFVAVAEAVELVGNRHAYGAAGKMLSIPLDESQSVRY